MLTSESKVGDFVLNNQELATKEGFRNVSKIWYNKTISYEDGLNQILNQKVNDVILQIDDIEVSNLQLGFNIDGQDLEITDHALGQFCSRSGIRQSYLTQLLERKDEFLRDVLAHELTRLKKVESDESYHLVRISNGQIRAFLSDSYRPISNEWFIEVLKEAIPGGRLSHWRGNRDTIYGNVLIPDTIRTESDSDYGGMLSVGNCEIGTRSNYSVPSIFRAICMNGCIWGRTMGVGIRQRHIGKFELDELKKKIITNLNEQIPLSVQGIDVLLNTKSFNCKVDPVCLMAVLADDFKLNVSEARHISKEYALSTSHDGTLFSLIDAVTRAGQNLSNERWYTFDTIGGQLMSFGKNDWSSFVNRAQHFSSAKINKLLGLNMVL